MSAVRLSERLMRLRITAASMYDLGVSRGLKPEEIQKTIAPITSALTKEIIRSAEEDLPGVAIAVHRLEHQVEAYKADLKYLMQKIIDDEAHIGMLKKAVVERMRVQGITEIQDQGYMATLAGDELTLR